MGAFKQLLASDVIVTPFEVNKAFRFTGIAALTASNVGIDRFLGQNTLGLFSPSNPTTGDVSLEYKSLIFNSVKQLYYTNYLATSSGDAVSIPYTLPGSDPSGDVLTGPASSAGRFENYLQTTLTQSRELNTVPNSTIGVISIPAKLFGEKIQPSSFNFICPSGSIYDDGEGNLINNSNGLVCGQIFYSHGLAVITDTGSLYSATYGTATYGTSSYGIQNTTTFIDPFISSTDITCSFSSSYTLFETQFRCTVEASDYSFTLNPSIISSSAEGTLYDFATGSYFNPYVTTVGLYNEAQDLIAVAKLAKPLPLNNVTDTNIIINIDR
jgi:hypothetical protein